MKLARVVRAGTALAVALLATARAAPGAQIPPSIEFRVPKPPTVAMSDSGALIAYELHVTNLTSTPMTLRRVEVLDTAGFRSRTSSWVSRNSRP